MDTHMHAWMHEHGKPVIGVTACLAVLALLAVSVWGWLQVISLVPNRSVNAPETLIVQSDSLPAAAASIEKPPRAATPAFTSLSLFADDLAGYSFWYPNGWELLPLSNGGYGVTLAPIGDEGDTWFSVEATDAPVAFAAVDAPRLVSAFHDILGALPGLCLEWEDQWVIGTIVGIEAKYTFRAGDATRKRWVRLLLDEGRQFSVTAQAASVEEYTYWEPMLFQMMTTVALDSDWYYPGESDDTPPQTGQPL